MSYIPHDQFTPHREPHELVQGAGDATAKLGNLALAEALITVEQYCTRQSRVEDTMPGTSELAQHDESAYLQAESYAAERKLAARNALLDIRNTQNLSDEELVDYIGLHTVMHSISTLRDPQIMIAASYELSRAIGELEQRDYARAD